MAKGTKEKSNTTMTLQDYIKSLDSKVGTNKNFEDKSVEEKLYYLYAWHLTVNAKLQEFSVVDQMTLLSIMSLIADGSLLPTSKITADTISMAQVKISKILPEMTKAIQDVVLEGKKDGSKK